MKANEISVTIEKITILGSDPIVVIGPNGGGKSKIGFEIDRSTERSTRIPALRQIEPPDQLGHGQVAQLQQVLAQQRNQTRSNRWFTLSDFSVLLGKIHSDDAEAAVKYRDKAWLEAPGAPVVTTKRKLVEMWNRHFPGRELDLSKYRPTVQAESPDPTAEAYAIGGLSDGEKATLYLIAKVVDSPSGLLIVDEPEVHLHPLLARTLWDELELLRPDCRFIYLTHDLAFALSRRPAHFVITRRPGEVELLRDINELPEELLESLLGAAAFLTVARRIIFCEGEKGGKDDRVYSAWFKDKNSIVIPVGGCDAVVRCVDVLRKKNVSKGAEVLGIIDRDYRSKDELEMLAASGVFISPVNEVEGFACMSDVFLALARYLPHPTQKPEERLLDFQERARDLQEMEFHRHVLERAKEAAYRLIRDKLSKVPPSPDKATMRLQLSAAAEKKLLEDAFDEAHHIMEAARKGPWEEFIRIIPAKSYWGKLADVLNYKVGSVLDLMCEALLDESPSSPFAALRADISVALGKVLPPRVAPTAAAGAAVPSAASTLIH